MCHGWVEGNLQLRKRNLFHPFELIRRNVNCYWDHQEFSFGVFSDNLLLLTAVL